MAMLEEPHGSGALSSPALALAHGLEYVVVE